MLEELWGVFFNSWAGKEKNRRDVTMQKGIVKFVSKDSASASWKQANQSIDVPVLCHKNGARLETGINCLKKKLVVLFIYIGFLKIGT